MIRLNLLPDIKREFLKTRRTEARVVSIALLATMISVGLTILLAFYAYIAQPALSKNYSSDIKKAQKEVKNIKDIDKYVTLQNQIKNISSLHQNKSITSKIFEILPKLNPVAPNNVKLSEVIIDTSAKTIKLTGETDTYTGLETFRDTLVKSKLGYTQDKKEIKDIQLFPSVAITKHSLGKNDKEKVLVSFDILVTYDDNLFKRDAKNVNIVVPNQETTQSKQDAPSVFGESSTVKQEGN